MQYLPQKEGLQPHQRMLVAVAASLQALSQDFPGKYEHTPCYALCDLETFELLRHDP
jgi:hypothetical protein